jgi:glycosyltransferase involved in cell wall biosynthesis
LAEALSQWANVTVAFRRVLEPIQPKGYEVVEIEPGVGNPFHRVDDAAVRGIDFYELLGYLRSVRRFIDERRNSYDIVLEKSWLLSGYMVSLCQRRGLPAAVVENIVRVWNEPVRNPRDLMRYIRYQLAQTLVGRYLRQAPLIIAETEELKSALSQQWRIPTCRIEVVGLGVDHPLFHPLNQADARRNLGIPQESTVLLYAGALDKTHDLTPVLEAMCAAPDPSLELHIVGDGVLRASYEEGSHARQKNIFFHGRVAHEMIPQYIAAADLCLAPYDPAAFPNGQVAYATLKVPEYLACARPVVSVPSGHILRLIQDGTSGFLFHNNAKSWVEFLRNLPSRDQLKRMGAAASCMASPYSWEATSLAYLSLCKQVVQKNRKKQTALPLCDPAQVEEDIGFGN